MTLQTPTKKSSSSSTTHLPSNTQMHPLVYSINARVLLKELSHLFSEKTVYHRCPNSEETGGCLTFEDVPDRYLDWIAQMGFQYVYLIGVWTTGEGGYKAAQEFMEKHFPDVLKSEVCSSPFAVTSYEIHPDFGGMDAFLRFRRRLARRNIRLILDFIPNHVGLDHQWVTDPTEETQEFILCGNEGLLKSQPQNFYKVNGRVVAHGKDPYYGGWVDTAQLNYFSSKLRKKMISIVEHISQFCDGVRCDMAMLVNSEIFMKTWGTTYQEMYTSPQSDVALDYPEFWPQVISRVLMNRPDFLFIGEVYWDLEQAMIDFGFHYVYDKRLYDELKMPEHGHQVKQWILDHSLNFHMKACHFLENHDELRAADVWKDIKIHRAAATIALTLPGMKLLHFGQFEGRRVKIPMQRCRLGREEQGDEAGDHRAAVFDTYYRLLDILNHFPVVRMGKYEHISAQPSSLDSHESHHKSIIAFTFYEVRSHAGVVRNASHAVNVFSSAPSSQQKLRGNLLGLSATGQGYISDESSSVPRSSTISEPDIDEMSEMTFGGSTAQGGEISKRGQRQTQQKGFLGFGSQLRVQGDFSKASQATSGTVAVQSAAMALHRSISDAPHSEVQTLQRDSSSVDYCEERFLQNGDDDTDQGNEDDDRDKAAKEEGYLSDTEEELNGETNGGSSSSSSPIVSHQRPTFSPSLKSLIDATSQQTPSVAPAVTPPSPISWFSSCDRFNPVLVIVNYSSQRAHGYIQLPKTLLRAFYARTGRFSVASSFPHGAEANFPTLGLTQTRGYILLRDVFVSGHSYRRNLLQAVTKGIWFDLQPWESHIFEALLLDEV